MKMKTSLSMKSIRILEEDIQYLKLESNKIKEIINTQLKT